MTCQLTEYKPCGVTSNLVEAMLSRLAHTYIDGPNIRAILTALLNQHVDVERALCELIGTLDIDTAQGAQLDIVGELVGLPRNVCRVYRVLFFGFKKEGDPECCKDLTVGLCEGPFFMGNEAQRFTDYRMVTDTEYRFFIKAMVFSNGFDGSVEQYEKLVHYLFDGIALEDPTPGTSHVLTHGGGFVSIAVERDLTDDEKRKAELYKFVLPYFGSTRVKILYGAGGFFRLGDTTNGLSDKGLCTNFAKVI